MKQFQFELGQQVAIAVSGEHGTVIGRAEYTNAVNSYYLHYKAADGLACKQWWDEDSLVKQCDECGSTGQSRAPYSAKFVPCDSCTSRPSSTASATTDASVNGSGSKA